jgi:type II secretory pathway component PulK
MYARPSTRRGFALLAVLWILIGISALALAMNLAGREAVAAANNRLNEARARWRAEGCLERVRATATTVLSNQSDVSRNATSWAALDSALATSALVIDAGCDVSATPAGVALNVNTASASTLSALMRASGLAGPMADSLAQNIVEWRGDDTTRASRDTIDAWYAGRHQILPRFGAYADERELHRVRGFDSATALIPSLDTLLTTENDPINLARAPAPVLASLPGFAPELVSHVLALRASGASVENVSTLATGLAPDIQDALLDHLIELRSRVAGHLDTWIVTVRSIEGTAPPIRSVIEVRFVRAGSRGGITRRRVWP